MTSTTSSVSSTGTWSCSRCSISTRRSANSSTASAAPPKKRESFLSSCRIGRRTLCARGQRVEASDDGIAERTVAPFHADEQGESPLRRRRYRHETSAEIADVEMLELAVQGLAFETEH